MTIFQQRSKALSVSDLYARFNGRVIAPGDKEYEQARTIFHGGMDRRPAAIIRVKNATEVSQVIALARDGGFELAVRSGGHSSAGHGTTEGGIVLDLSGMKNLYIDVDQKIAWAGTGLTAGEYTNATAVHGLVTSLGDTASVGLSGLTLGGGIGYLVRKYGLTIDSLLAAEVVTADGRILQVDDSHYPDLFWAIRGGGGNFGVATQFKLRLQEIDQIYGGMLILPATADVITNFVEEADAAPEELSGILNILPAPPLPFLPLEYHGQIIALATMVYAGNLEEGERVIAPFRKMATPLIDMVKAMPYREIYPPDDENHHPIVAARTMFLDHVDRSTAETILDRLRSSTAMAAVTQLRVLGGAMARVPPEATAFAHRHSRIMANLAAIYVNLADKAAHEAWADEFQRAIWQNDQGAYVNFLTNEGEARVQAAYPGATWERLQEIKSRYDPDNLFCVNHNIPPKR